MARGSVNKVVRIAPETVAGTHAATGYKELPGLNIELGPNVDAKRYRASGSKYNTTSRIHRISGTGRYTGPMTFSEIVYVLSSICGKVTPSTPSGATAAREWLFQTKSRGSDPFQTYSVLQGDDDAAELMAYAVFTDMTLTFGLDDATMSGTMRSRAPLNSSLAQSEVQQAAITGSPTGGNFTLTFGGNTTANIPYNATAGQVQAALEALASIGVGNVIVTGGPLPASPVLVNFVGTLAGTNVASITATATGLTGGTSPAVNITTPTTGGGAATITRLTQLPMSAREVNIYLDDSYAARGTTQLVDPFNASLAVGNKYNDKWVLNRNFQSFKEMVEVPPDLNFTFQLEHGAQSRALYAQIQSNPLKFGRIEVLGPEIETGQRFLIQVDTAFNVTGSSDADVDGDWARTYTCAPLDNNTLNRPFEVLVRNDVAAL